MTTPSQYGPYSDRRSVAREAKKLCQCLDVDTFVVEESPWKYRVYSADFPGDTPHPARVVETFRAEVRVVCEHENAKPSLWSWQGKLLQMRCPDCNETAWVEGI